MANTKYLKVYILLFVLFYSMVGYFNLSDTDTNLQNYMPIKNIIDSLNNKWISNVIKVVLIPFIIIDYIIILLYFIGISWSLIPIILNLLLITPIAIFIMFDYVVPLIRGSG